MAVFIKDVLERGGLKLMIWTILLIVGCIKYVHAAGITISVTGGTEVTGTTMKTYKVDVSGGAAVNVDLTCGGASGGDNYLLRRNEMRSKDTTYQTSFQCEPTATFTIPLDETTSGSYMCRSPCDSRDGGSPSVILTVGCTPGGPSDSCTNVDVLAECDNTNSYCKCKLNKTGDRIPAFPECFECVDDEDCPGAKTPKCSPREHVVNPPIPPRKCVACDEGSNAGCSGKTPYCEKAGEPCQPCNTTDNKPCRPVETCESTGECKAKTKSSSVAPSGPTNTAGTGASGTGETEQTSKEASVTSSAGTVTSTACLVIASVVVALMN